MIPTPVLQTTAGAVVREAYAPPAGSRGILAPITHLIRNAGTVALFPFYDAKIVCKLPGGQIYYESQLAVDTDGSRFASQDGTGQAKTAWTPGGRSIDADAIPYFSEHSGPTHHPATAPKQQ